MAVTTQGFSIREYTWRMRSVNMVKCWPFDATNEDEMKSQLPPMTVKKFTWWFDKLKLKEGSNNEDSKKKFTRNEPEDMDESDNSIDRRVTKKGKSPKKRSIVELFAVAPQVETMDDVDDYEDDDKGSHGSSDLKFSDDLDRKGKNKEKKVKSKLIKQKKVTKKYNKKEKTKELHFMNFKIAKKERSFKLRMHSSMSFVEDLNGSLSKKELPMDNLDAISKLMKKPRVKYASTEKKRKPAFPLRSILKNYTKIRRIQSSTNCKILENAPQVNCSEAHEVNKHVTFLVNNDTDPFAKNLDTIRDKSISANTGSEHEHEHEHENLCGRCLTMNPVPDWNLLGPTYAPDSRYPKSSEGYGPHTTTQWGDLLGNREPKLAELSYYKDFMYTNPHPSSSSLPNFSSNAMQAPQFPSNPIRRNYNDLPFPYFTPKELMRTIYGDNFVGLPLNSHGEIIKFDSTGQRPCWDGRRSLYEHAHEHEGFQFFPTKDMVSENTFFPMPYDYQSTQRTNFGYEHSNLERMIHAPDHISLHGTQTTMRLMGQEFTIGTRELQPLNVWTDKQIISEHLLGPFSQHRVQSNYFTEKLGEPFASYRTPSSALDDLSRSGFIFPFLNPFSEDDSRSPWRPNTSRSIYPCGPYATQNETIPFFTDLGINHRPEAFHRYNPSGFDASSHRSPVPMTHHRPSLNLALPSRYGGNFRGPTYKRPAISSPNFMNTCKVPNLTFQENYSFDGHANREGDLGLININQGDQFEDVQNRFKVSSGSFKLTGGAKHILKPCQNAGQNNSRSIQSTIRFIDTGDAVLESEKSAKIYKF